MNQFQTSAAYVSGAICGAIWWPVGTICGIPYKRDLRGYSGMEGGKETFRDCLLRFLINDGGDFQNPEFTEDTIIRIERRTRNTSGNYKVHVKEYLVSELAPDLVRKDSYVCDFLGEE